jgi:hypothetical protein
MQIGYSIESNIAAESQVKNFENSWAVKGTASKKSYMGEL